jgi:hypothetical protein
VNELLERRFNLQIHPSKRVNVYTLEGESPFGKGESPFSRVNENIKSVNYDRIFLGFTFNFFKTQYY